MILSMHLDDDYIYLIMSASIENSPLITEDRISGLKGGINLSGRILSEDMTIDFLRKKNITLV